ncbi:hypothetical protein SAMN05421548_1412 [Paraburkholderia lycopersici]|uniref:DUF6869 domain-containing protein n=2 Tax=Paraburkholderia lycopersici TaxID=416944 RepID=A0A1G7BSA9_9BURK|nr:hypothetical protein SAMN05421548_1412 [Paraburkholderia lycopersici]
MDYEKNFWAHMTLDDLIDEDASKALVIIEHIAKKDGSEFALANLAAGPLETLLSKHGEALIDNIKISVKSNSELKSALGLIWKNNIPGNVWDAIQKIR